MMPNDLVGHFANKAQTRTDNTMLKSISCAVPVAIVVAGLGCVALTVGRAQTAATPAGASKAGKAVVLGTGSFTGFVENMDRSLAFYHDAFGMDVPALPASGQRAYNPENPALFKFFDIMGAKERHQSARVAGTRVTLELMEIQQVPSQTIALRIQDPGAATIVFIVRDVDAALARATQAKATMVTPGGKPVTLADGGRSILVRDLDGRFVELRQLPNGAAIRPPVPPTAGAKQAPPQPSDILDMRLSIAVNDMDATTKFYRNVLGFTVEGETKFTADKAMRSLTGLSKAQVRQSRIQAPASALWIELVEYKGVDRTPLHMKIQDRGAARLQLRVQDVDAVVAAVKAAGLRIMSVDGVGQPIPPNLKGALVADPNNFFLTPYAPCDGCAPTVGGPPRATK
jgi:catechol 2,3-dioxygenase-like lactoylglutathione lyase family enzyme